MSIKIIHSKSGAQIGVVHFIAGKGWFCIPWTAAHKPSRKGHQTVNDAIPRWMKKMGILMQMER